MKQKINLNLFTYQIFICSLLFSFSGYSQINRTVFHEDFEKTDSAIQAIWTPTANYTIDPSSFSGKGVVFNSLNSTTNLVADATVSSTDLVGRTIAISASVKGQDLTTGIYGEGMVIQLIATSSLGAKTYYRLPVKTGTFTWEQIGNTFIIQPDIVSLSLDIGIYNATGNFWIDNLHIQVIAEPMPDARTTPVVIDKTHAGMYRGMNVAANSDTPANIISKNSLDELSYDWKANSIRVMIGGDKYYPDGLLRSDYDAVLQTELVRMDELVTWCTANGLKMNVGLAGLSDGLFSSQAAQTRLINAWKLIAARYKNNSTVWSYDLANEPVVSKQYPYNYTYPLDNTIMMWPSLAEALVNAIRVIDPVKSIIIESLNYGVTLDDIKPIDASVPNIIYSVHMYQPGQLTGQFGPATPAINYPGTINNEYYDKDKLKQILAPLKAYQEKYRVPIYIGEFSCVRWAPGESAYNYIRDCIEIFEEYNWDYDYYAFRVWNGWSVEHSNGFYDDVLPTTKTNRELLMRQYFALNQGPPNAPTIGTASSGNAQASVAFTAPTNNGGSAITTYTATSTPGNFTASGTASPLVVLGLTNGTAYTFTITATNANGTGIASAASNSVTPATIPGAPTIGTASSGNAQASVAFTAPTNNGGSAITTYTATSTPGSFTASGTASPLVVLGLTNGTAYTFKVTATNAIGTGIASAASNSVTPATVPGAPAIGTATRGNAQASVAFTAPTNNGGSAITTYTATSTPGSLTASGATSPLVVLGLTNGTAYTFKVTATNAIGTGIASAASNSVTPATVPGAPTIGTATRGNAKISVAFTAPSNNGGSAITTYTATSTPGSFTASGATSPLVVLGLTNGTAYTFKVTATNAIGTGIASSASNSVTPATVPGAPTIGTATPGNAKASVVFTAPSNNGGSTITTYTATSTPGSFTASGAASPLVVLGLTNGTAYTFKVTATNAVGKGSASAASNSVTPRSNLSQPVARINSSSKVLVSKSFFYPNPVQSVLNLELMQDNNRLEVWDLSGKRVFEKNVPSKYKFDMSIFDSGIYLIRVENADGILEGKVIKK